ncbi:MAG TPA: phosphohistidine phosphatase SixA [Vicinamibacterales bacterium]|jgi:phosphohistidine phosphatase
MPSCEIYIVRHAIAAERGEAWPDDTKRPLTTRGVNRFRDSLAGLKWLDFAVDEIFSSPLVRAKQTADLLAAGIQGSVGVKILDALAPGHAPAVVMGQLAKAAKRQRVALVGHEPDLGGLAAHLIGASHALAFKKGGMCRIDIGALSPRRTGSLVWFVTPKMLRKLAG